MKNLLVALLGAFAITATAAEPARAPNWPRKSRNRRRKKSQQISPKSLQKNKTIVIIVALQQ
jgi:hypothetical protein